MLTNSSMCSKDFFVTARSFAFKKRAKREMCEDFVGFAVEKFIASGKQRHRLDLLWIDFLRSELGTGTKLQQCELNESQAVTHNSFEEVEFNSYLTRLNESERQLARQYFCQGQSMDEIAVSVHLSKTRVKQLIDGVVEKIKKNM